MHSELDLGEYIGTESCTDNFMPDTTASRGGAGTSRRRSRRREAAVTEYPPPIPMLALTENLPTPWVLMKKHGTSDGRLLITEEKLPRHDYFQVHRSDGRLVLNLVPSSVDAVEEEEEPPKKGEEKLGFPGNVEFLLENDGGDPAPPPQEVVPPVHT